VACASGAEPAAAGESYDAVAPRYARLARCYGGALAARLVRLARLAPGASVLDVGTGSGLLALEAARVVGPDGRVLGVDVSAALLAEARSAAAGLAFVRFERMEAEALALPDRSFDAVLSLFAIAHVRDPAAALGEMWRVLRPGGRMVLARGSAAPRFRVAGLSARMRRLPLALARWRGRCLVAPGDVERMVADEGPRALGVTPHVPEARLTALARAAGFTALRTAWVGDEKTVGSGQELWDLATTFSTPLRAWLAAARREEREALRARVLEASRAVEARGGRLVYPQGAAILSARRPEDGT